VTDFLGDLMTAPDPGCPTWCDRARGHHLDTHDGVARRVHLGPSRDGARLEQFETVGPAGLLVRGPEQVASDSGRVPVTAMRALAGAA